MSTRLKKILYAKGMTQKELSILTEVQQYKISQLCSGKRQNIHLSTAKRICEVLNCSLDEIFGESDK